MNKLSSLNLLVAAALIALAAGNAGAEETTPHLPAAPAGQTAPPGTGYVPDWYPPRTGRYGYAQPWSQPSQRPAPPPGYGQIQPYSPAYGQYRPVPDAPVANPLDTRLQQAQDQLVAKTTELDSMRAQLARLQTELQAATAALQKAQSDTLNAGRQVGTTRAQVDTLQNILCELAARIERRNTALQDTLKTAAASPDDPDSAAAVGTNPATAEQVEPQTNLQCSQLTPPPPITSGQRGITVITQAR